MEPNGRQRASLPGSSTFRRLPTLTRSPFRRADKSSSPPPPESETLVRNNSAFPSLARVVVDESSLSSALFGAPISSISEEAPHPIVPSPIPYHQQPSQSQPQPQARSTSPSALASPIISSTIEFASPKPIPSSASTPGGGFYGGAVPSSPISSPYPYSTKVPQRTPMPASALPAIGSSPATGFDLEPITYPAHLAQTRPPQQQPPADSSVAPSPSSPPPSSTPSAATTPQAAPSPASGGTPGAAPAVPARSAHRYRDFTLGNSQAAFASAMNLTTTSLGPPNSMSSLGINGITSPGPAVDAALTATGTVERSGGAGAPSSSSGPAGSRRPSGSQARKPSVSAQAVHGSSSRDERRREKEDADSAEDGGKRSRNPSEGGTRARRPPKARERGDPTKTNTSEDGDGLLGPILPSAKVARAPASAMYFSPVAAHGRPPGQALRAHTGTLVGDRIWFLGGVDARSCWRGVASFDTESLQWSTIETHGEALPPLRAHTTTLVGDQLYIFGGGDGPTYSNDVWVFDTITHRFSRPNIVTPRASLPPPRRAHTTVLYRNYLVVFGGGNGQAALNDVWALDVSDPSRLTWNEWRTRGDVPQKKGYHTANLVGDKMIVFGGSDGHASFADVHVLDLRNMTWTLVPTEVKHNRLSHTATQVGSYLFVIGGHNGQTYAQDVLLFNLTTLAWESKVPKGVPPPGRGYHVAVLHDARIFISGGYNGVAVFDDLWSLDLGAGAYLPQVTTFEVNEQSEHLRLMGLPAPTKNGPSGPGGRI